MEDGYHFDFSLDLTVPSRLLAKFDPLVEVPSLVVEIPISHHPDVDQLTVHLEQLQVSIKAVATSTRQDRVPVSIRKTQVNVTPR